MYGCVCIHIGLRTGRKRTWNLTMRFLQAHDSLHHSVHVCAASGALEPVWLVHGDRCAGRLVSDHGHRERRKPDREPPTRSADGGVLQQAPPWHRRYHRALGERWPWGEALFSKSLQNVFKGYAYPTYMYLFYLLPRSEVYFLYYKTWHTYMYASGWGNQ